MSTGLPCWSSHLFSRSGYTHTHQHSPGCHCPVTSNQQHEPLLTFSLAMSTIFFILKYAPLAMPKASYPGMESVLIPILGYMKTSFSACTSTELTAVHFSSWNHTPVLFPGIQFCFSITQFKNSNCIINWNISSSNSTSTSTSWTMWISITCQRELPVWCPTLGTSLCHGTLMSMHWASQITSEKLAILDCNCFIKSTTNWYPEASKEPFYCILWILSNFTQLAANFTYETLFNIFKTHLW